MQALLSRTLFLLPGPARGVGAGERSTVCSLVCLWLSLLAEPLLSVAGWKQAAPGKPS